MKIYGGMEMQLYAFISVPDGGELTVSHSSKFTHRETAIHINSIRGWVGSRPDIVGVVKRKIAAGIVPHSTVSYYTKWVYFRISLERQLSFAIQWHGYLTVHSSTESLNPVNHHQVALYWTSHGCAKFSNPKDLNSLFHCS
jgi:hypothetical protein